jgi:hypothetical protein
MGFIRDFFARRKLRGPSGSVRQMFFERAEKFTATTVEILNRMPGALEAISELIEEKESFKSGGVLNWSEVSLVRAESEDALIVMVGAVTFPPGAEVELQTGEKVIVTADTAQYFEPRMVRIGIPLRLAEAPKDIIKEYIKKSEEIQKKESEEFMKNLEEALTTKLEDAGIEVPVKVVPKQDSVTTDDDFDLTQLTEEQRKQLVLSQKIGRG